MDEVRIVQVPRFADSISEGDIRWDKGVGDAVREDEVVGEIETDKTSMPINAPAAGIIEALLVEDGTTVKPGMEIFKLRLVAGAGGAAPVSSSKRQEPSPPVEPTPTPVEEAALSPPPPPPQVQQETRPPPPAPRPEAKSPPVPTPPKKMASSEPPVITSGLSRGEERVKMNRMRIRIGQRLKDAQNTYAMLTTFNEIDMTNIMATRTQHKDAFLKKHNLKLGFMSAFVKATAYALTDQPVVNAVIDENEVIYRVS